MAERLELRRVGRLGFAQASYNSSKVASTILKSHGNVSQPTKLPRLKKPSMTLPEPIRLAASACIFDLYPKWMTQTLIDQRRTVRPQGNDSSTIAIEFYRGTSTVGNFLGVVKKSDYACHLADAIRMHEPKLIGHMAIPGSSSEIQVERLVIGWLKFIEAHHSKKDLEAAVKETLDNFSNILYSERIPLRIVTTLSGLSLPDDINEIQLEENLTLRKLRKEELVELSSNDISSSSLHSHIDNRVTTCIEKLTEIPVRFSSDPTPLPHQDLDMHNEVLGLLVALHILKPGSADVFLTLPYMDGAAIDLGISGYSHPLYRLPRASFEFNVLDLEEFISIYTAVQECTRNEVIIAAGRLLDSEHRSSAVDALLDSVIGLEVLLNPIDFGELSFRVAMNHAYLGEPQQRRQRYEKLKGVQSTRNKVVHGGLNINSTKASVILENAEIARDCLRDTLKHFLFDKTLKNAPKKLSADFWLDRMLPPV